MFTAIAAPYRVRFVIAEPNALPKNGLRVTVPALCARCRAGGWIETPRCQFYNLADAVRSAAPSWGRWQSRRLAPGGFAVLAVSKLRQLRDIRRLEGPGRRFNSAGALAQPSERPGRQAGSRGRRESN